MSTIKVITLHNIRNYGSALQTLATQELFRQFGLKVEIINYQRPDSISTISRIRKWVMLSNSSPLVKLTKSIILFPSFVIQNIKFKRFLSKYINLGTNIYSTENDFAKMPIDADIYCTGSDQTWNSGWNGGILKPLFLSFVPDKVRKIAYSASFGKSKLEKWEKEETKHLLERYDYISVREASGIDILEDLEINGGVLVLDPTLQMPKSFWEKYMPKIKIKEKYILVYQLNTNKNFDNYAAKFAKRKGIRLVRFCNRIDQVLKSGKALIIPDILEFASLICAAECVITDSFHATAFAVNMNTEFICIYPDEYSSRIASILELVGLQHRHLQSYDDFSFVDAPPTDFVRVNNILEKQRKIGLNYLNKALNI